MRQYNNNENHNHSNISTHSNWYKIYERNNPVSDDLGFRPATGLDIGRLQPPPPPPPPPRANSNNCYKTDMAGRIRDSEQFMAAAAARMRVLYDYRAPAGTRWSPTAQQLQELQALFHVGGLRTPSAAQISRITARLRRHGRIEGRNVFYWFQNQKARERKHRSMTGSISGSAPIRQTVEPQASTAAAAAEDLLHSKNRSLGSVTPLPSRRSPPYSLEINRPTVDTVEQAPSNLHSAAGPGEIENANACCPQRPSSAGNESVDPTTSSIISKSNSSPYPMTSLCDELVVDDHEMSPTLQLQRYNHQILVSKPTALMQLFPLSPLNLEPHDQLLINCNVFSSDVDVQPCIDHLQSYTTSPTTTASSSNNSNGWNEALISGHVASKSTAICNPNWLDLKLAMNY